MMFAEKAADSMHGATCKGMLDSLVKAKGYSLAVRNMRLSQMFNNWLSDIHSIHSILPLIPAKDRGWNEAAMGDDFDGLEMESFTVVFKGLPPVSRLRFHLVKGYWTVMSDRLLEDWN